MIKTFSSWTTRWTAWEIPKKKTNYAEKLVDSYTELTQSLFYDYEMKMQIGKTSSVVDYEENILKMTMRK